MGPAAREITEMTWPDLQRIITRIADEIRSGGTPQILVAISRGGLVPAVMLSHLLDVRDLRVLTISHTVDDQVYAAKTGTPRVRRPETLATHHPGRIRTMALTANAAKWPPSQPGRPDYIGMLIHSWVAFPWERQAASNPGG
jgi:hypothetical protein